VAVAAVGEPDVVAVEERTELAGGNPAWKNSDSVGFDGAVLRTVFTSDPGAPSASAVL